MLKICEMRRIVFCCSMSASVNVVGKSNTNAVDRTVNSKARKTKNGLEKYATCSSRSLTSMYSMYADKIIAVKERISFLVVFVCFSVNAKHIGTRTLNAKTSFLLSFNACVSVSRSHELPLVTLDFCVVGLLPVLLFTFSFTPSPSSDPSSSSSPLSFRLCDRRIVAMGCEMLCCAFDKQMKNLSERGKQNNGNLFLQVQKFLLMKCCC